MPWGSTLERARSVCRPRKDIVPIHLETDPSPQTKVRVRLVALTGEAVSALNGSELRIDIVPFRIGRESRRATRVWDSLERRLGRSQPSNDLYLLPCPDDPVEHIARNHAMITIEDGRFLLVDRQSEQGTLVDYHQVGGGRLGGSATLHDRTVITFGTAASPYRFRFHVEGT